MEQVVAERQLRASSEQDGEAENISRDGQCTRWTSKGGLFGGGSTGMLVATGTRRG